MAIFSIFFVWFFVLLTPWIKYSEAGPPYSFNIFLLCIMSPITFFAPVLLFRIIFPSSQKNTLTVKVNVLLASAFLSFLSIVLFFMAYSDLSNLDINTAKVLYSSEKVEPIKGYWRSAVLLAPSIPLFLFGALKRAKERFWRALILVFLAFSGLMLGSRFGARYDTLCFLIYLLSGAFWMYNFYILKNALRLSLYALLFFIGFIILNIGIGFYRNASDANMNSYKSVLVDGQQVLNSIGLTELNDSVAYAAGVLDDYFFSNVSRFEIFYEGYTNTENLGYGQVMFSIPATQLGYTKGAEIKRAVDDMYKSEGIKVNIWATGLRDIYMDFGFFGLFCFLFIFGFIYAICNKLAFISAPAGICAVFLLAFSVFLPFGSIWKSPFLQSGFIFWIFLVLVDFFTKQFFTNLICSR